MTTKIQLLHQTFRPKGMETFGRLKAHILKTTYPLRNAISPKMWALWAHRDYLPSLIVSNSNLTTFFD